MIEKLKQRPKKINETNLSHVNSWWDKILVKNTKKVQKYLHKFGKDGLALTNKQTKKKEVNYPQFLSLANKSLEFLMQKEKQMLEEIKVVQKLQKMIIAFGEQAGIVAHLQTIDKFYQTIDKTAVANKKELAIKLGNETIMNLYGSYKELILKILGKDEIIKEKLLTLYSTDNVNDEELFNVAPTLKILFKFASLAFRSSKITKKEFCEIYFNTIFLNAYLAMFSNLYQRFVIQLSLASMNNKKKG